MGTEGRNEWKGGRNTTKGRKEGRKEGEMKTKGRKEERKEGRKEGRRDGNGSKCSNNNEFLRHKNSHIGKWRSSLVQKPMAHMVKDYHADSNLYRSS
jgi:hypothetical protein